LSYFAGSGLRRVSGPGCSVRGAGECGPCDGAGAVADARRVQHVTARLRVRGQGCCVGCTFGCHHRPSASPWPWPCHSSLSVSIREWRGAARVSSP